MNLVLATAGFWELYFTLETDEELEEEVTQLLERLGADYPCREETGTYEHAGKQHTFVRRWVEFPFACGENTSLVIEFEPSAWGSELNFFFRDEAAGTKAQMG